MFSLALDGLWLIAALAFAVLTGIFIAQYVKDKIQGVPAPLRAALNATEAAALNELKAVKGKVAAEVAALINRARVAAAAEIAPKPLVVPAPPVAPAPAPDVPKTTGL